MRVAKALTLEILSVRFLNIEPRDYIAEISRDGIRMRRKGTAKWIGPATWEQILSSACRRSHRDGEQPREMAVGS